MSDPWADIVANERERDRLGAGGTAGGFDPSGTGYDYETAKRFGLKPDETGHWQSRAPNGQILKGSGHETFSKTLDGETAAGYEIQRGSDGRLYSQPSGQLGRSIVTSVDRNPDEAARQQVLSRRSGLPVPVVELDQARAEREARLREIDIQGLPQRSPATAKALEDPALARVAHDDVANMGLIERYTRDIGQRGQRGRTVLELNQLGFQDLSGRGDIASEARISRLQLEESNRIDYGVTPGPLGPIPAAVVRFIPGMPGAVAEALPMIGSSIVSSVEGGLAGAAGGAVVGGVAGLAGGPGAPATVPAGALAGAAAGYATGSGLGMYISSAKMEAGGMWLEIRNIQDEKGQPVDPVLGRSMALAGGAIAGFFETAATKYVLKAIPGLGKLTGGFIRSEVKKALADRTFRAVASGLIGSSVKRGFFEGGTEGVQEVTSIAMWVASNYATTGKGIEALQYEAKNPETGEVVVLTGWQAAFARTLDAGYSGAQMGAGVAAGGQAMRVVTDSQRAQDALARVPKLERLMQAVGESKVLKRDPEAFKQHAREVAAASGVTTVYIEPEAMRKFFQEVGPEEAEKLAAEIPELREQNVEVGTAAVDFAIPFEAYLSHPALVDGLADAVRFDPRDMSAKEALGFQEGLEREMGSVQEMVGASKNQAGADAAIERELSAQLRKVYPDTVVPPMVTFTMERLRTRAERLGKTVQQVVEDEGLFRVQGPQDARPEASGLLPPSLDEKLGGLKDAARVKQVLQDLRAQRTPEQKDMSRRPLVEALRDLGGVDPTGDLATTLRELGIPDRGKGSIKGLYREGGIKAGDNLVGDETEIFTELVDPETGYVDPIKLERALGNEVAGTLLRTQAEGEVISGAEAERSIVRRALEKAGLALDADEEAIVAAVMAETQREFGQPTVVTFKQSMPEERVPTRTPTAKKSTEDPRDVSLTVDVKSIREIAPETLRNLVSLFSGYAGFGVLGRNETVRLETAREALKTFTETKGPTRQQAAARAKLDEVTAQKPEVLAAGASKEDRAARKVALEAWRKAEAAARKKWNAATAAKQAKKKGLEADVEKALGKSNAEIEASIEQIKQQIKDNLRSIWEKVPSEIRERTRVWYIGANALSTRFADRYGYDLRVIAGVIASQSPQKDWNMNVSLAERILEVWTKAQGEVLTDQMIADAKARNVKSLKMNKGKTPIEREAEAAEFAARMDALAGKALAELEDDVHAAMFVRAYSQGIHSREFRIVTPEGEFGEIATGIDEESGEKGIAWGGFKTIANAISMLKDPRLENISARLGEQHKVRNFYNNIIDPTNAVDVTIDTHAVGAALLRALSGTDTPVTHNFSGPGSSVAGTSGTYAIFADAYRELAGELGVLPRELQSVTWEAVRSMFPAALKDGMKGPVEEIWKRYDSGDLTIDQARTAIYELTKGIPNPESTGDRQLSGAGRDTSFSEVIPQSVVRPGERAGQSGRDAGGAPDGGAAVPARARGTGSGGVDVFKQTAEEAIERPEFKAWAGDAEVVLDPENHDFVPGKPVVVKAFHGTTHEFETIDISKAHAMNDLGRAFYLTSSEADVETNYKGVGPDLTARLESETEYLEQTIPDAPSQYGLPDDADPVVVRNHAEKLARQKLVGKAESGRVIEAFVKMNNPAILSMSGRGGTWIDFTPEMDEDGEWVADPPNMTALVEYLEGAADDVDVTAILDRVAGDYEVSAMALKLAITTSDATDENGELISADLVSGAFRALGFDGVIYEDASQHFPGMEMDPGTKHFVVWNGDGSQVKDVTAKDFDASSPNIYREGERGSISMTEDLRDVVIRFTEARDLSTFLHESGHLFLAQLIKDAAEAGGQLAADLQTVREALAAATFQSAEDIDLFSEAAQETWARWFEAYLFEGKSPSLKLDGIFARFQSWLVRIYKKLTGIPGYKSNLAPDIRQVMDRLLATDAAIAEANEASGFLALDAAALGLTEEQSKDYNGRVQKGLDEARRQLQVQLMSELAQQKTRDWADLKAGVRAEVKANVEARPAFRAKQWLSRGEVFEGQVAPELEHLKLSREMLIEMKGKEIMKLLPSGKYSVWQKEGGYHPDFVAEVFGFGNGEALLTALEAAGKIADVIEAETETEMQRRHGTFQTSESIENAALEALMNDKQVAALEFAERAIAAKAGSRVIPVKILRATAERLIGQMRYRDVQPYKYRAAASRASREAIKLIAQGDFPAAQISLRHQITNLLMEAEARKRITESDRAIDYLGKVQGTKSWSRIGKAGADYQEQIGALLERFELRKGQSLKQIDKLKSLHDWIVEQEENGEEVIIPPKLRDAAFRQSWKELTIEDLASLRDSVKNIEHLALRKNEYIANRDRRQRDEVVTDLVAALETNLRKRPISKNQTPTSLEALKRGLVSAETAVIKMEFLIDYLDGGDPQGPWRQNVFEPTSKMQANRLDKTQQFTIEFAKLMDALVNGDIAEWNRRFYVPQLDRNFTRWNLIALALNVGNEGNLYRLVEGNKFGDAAIQSVLDLNMTKSDWDFVQQTWNLIDRLWPEISDQQKRLVGIVPEKVQRRVVKTPFGDYEGGYFPVVYDPSPPGGGAPSFVHANASKGLYEGLENGFQRPITGHGHTVERKHVAGPLLLDLKVIPGHLDQVIHDLTHREGLMQIDKLLSNPKIRAAFEQHEGGLPWFQMFRPWLQGVATDRIVDNRALSGLATALRFIRTNTTSFAMGLRETTLLMQATGHSNAMGHLKDRLPNYQHWLNVGRKKAVAGFNIRKMQEVYQSVREASGEMRHVIGNMDRDARDVIRRNQVKVTALARVKKASMELIGKVQMFAVNLPVWLGAYEGALNEFDYTHDQAVEFADAAIRMSQGAAGAKDLSAIQRADEGYKQFTTFFSYRNLVYNQVTFEGRRTRKIADVGSFLGAYGFYITLPFIGAALVRSMVLGGHDQFPDEDSDVKDWAVWFVANNLAEFLALLPFVDETAGIVQATTGKGRYFAKATPVQRIAAMGVDVVTPKDELDAMFSAMRITAALTGMPADRLLTITEAEIRDME